MRPFRVCKAPTMPTWLGSRAASSKAELAHVVDDLREAEVYGSSTLVRGSVASLPIARTIWLSPRVFTPIGGGGIARFSISTGGGSGQSPGKPKDPALLLGAGWEGWGEDVAVAVWWDFENCNVPLGIEVYRVGVNIVSGLRMCGFKGPVSISAYGDTLQLSRSTQEALASTGIRLHHIPSGGKDSSDRAILVDLILWTFEHPPPAHLFLISGDRDFSNALHRLRMMNYNILLACPAGTIVSPALLGAASHVWQWNCLVRGEGLLLANPLPDSRPPDGSSGGASVPRQTVSKVHSPTSSPLGSRGPDGISQSVDTGGKPAPPAVSPSPLSHLKAVDVSPVCPGGSKKRDEAPIPPLSPQGLKSSPEESKVSRPSSESVPRKVPKEVLQKFKNLLASHPKGIRLADLQSYISNEKLCFDKDFYGCGKIVPFLSSIPEVVQVERVLMKDNKSWTYLLTPAQKTAESKQQGLKVTAEDVKSVNSSVDTDIQKTSTLIQKTQGHTSKKPETSSKAPAETALPSHSPPRSKEEKLKTSEVSQVQDLKVTEQVVKSTNLSIEQDLQKMSVTIQKTQVLTSKGTETSSKAPAEAVLPSQPPLRSKEEKLKTPKVSQVPAESTEQIQDNSLFVDGQLSRPQKGKINAESGGATKREISQLQGESSPLPPSVETSIPRVTLDQMDSDRANESVQARWPLSFVASLAGMFRRRQVGNAVDSTSHAAQKLIALSVDKKHFDKGDEDNMKPSHPEKCSKECKKSDLKVSYDAAKVGVYDIKEVGLADKDGTSKERFMEGAEGFSGRGAGSSEESVHTVTDEFASGGRDGNLRGKEALAQESSTIPGRSNLRQKWRKWLFGEAAKDPSSSFKGRSMTGRDEALTGSCSSLPTDYDLSDLDKVTWKEPLSWPQKPCQNHELSEPKCVWASQPTKENKGDEALLGSFSSSIIQEQKFDHGKTCSGKAREVQMEYLCSAEDAAVLLEAPNRIEALDSSRMTGPLELPSSQFVDCVDQPANSEAGPKAHQFAAQDAHSHVDSDRIKDGPSTYPGRQVIKTVECINTHIDQFILPDVQGGRRLAERRTSSLEEEEPHNGSRHVESKVIDELLKKPLAEFSSSSKDDMAITEQDSKLKSLDTEPPPLRAASCAHDSSSAAPGSLTSLNTIAASYPSLENFQEWFLESLKEAHRLSERTRRMGFDLSLVKPDFEREFGTRLDPRAYGYIKLQDLITSISSIRLSWPRKDQCVVFLLKEGESCKQDQCGETKANTSKGCLWPQMYHDCKLLVQELMLQYPDGLPAAQLKPLFISRFQYPLDHKCVGYQKMSDLLRLMPDIVSVNGKLLVPSKELLSSMKDKVLGEASIIKGNTVLISRAVEDNVTIELDVDLEPTGFQSSESLGEIDAEGNGNTLPLKDVEEVTLEDGQGPQNSSVIEELPIGKHMVVSVLMSADKESEGICELSERDDFSREGDLYAMVKGQQEFLNSELSTNDESRCTPVLRTSKPTLACSENLQVCEAPVDVMQLDKGTADEFVLQPLVTLTEREEVHESDASCGSKDDPAKSHLLVIKENQIGTIDISEEAPKPVSSSTATLVISKSGEEAGDEGGLESEAEGALDVLGDKAVETVIGSTASSFHETSVDNILSDVENITDDRRRNEYEASQTVNSTGQIDEALSKTSKHSPDEQNSLFSKASSQGHVSRDEPSDTWLKLRPSTDKVSSEECCVPGDNANGSCESRKDESCSGSKNSSSRKGECLASSGTISVEADLLMDSKTSNTIHDNEPERGEEWTTSKAVEAHDSIPRMTEERSKKDLVDGKHAESSSPKSFLDMSVLRRFFPW